MGVHGAGLLQLRAMHCQRAMTRKTGGRLRVQAMQALLHKLCGGLDRYVGQSRLCFVVGLKIQGKLGPKAKGSQGKILMLSNTRPLVFHFSLSVFILILQSLTLNLIRA